MSLTISIVKEEMQKREKMQQNKKKSLDCKNLSQPQMKKIVDCKNGNTGKDDNVSSNTFFLYVSSFLIGGWDVEEGLSRAEQDPFQYRLDPCCCR